MRRRAAGGGDGRQEWDVETDKLFNEYSQLLESAPDALVPRIEKALAPCAHARGGWVAMPSTPGRRARGGRG